VKRHCSIYLIYVALSKISLFIRPFLHLEHFALWPNSFIGFNPLKTKRRLLYLKTQSVPRCKHFPSRLQKPISLWCKWRKSPFVLRINTKHINTVWAERTIVEC